MKKNQSCNKQIKKTLCFLNNKHKIEILYCLSEGTMRFSEIKNCLENITQQLLTKQLKQLEHDNLISRNEYDGFPRKVEYSLTSFGITTKSIMNSMIRWEKKNYRTINTIMKKNPDSLYDYY